MRIVHFINSLDVGGTEKMLLKLVNSEIFKNDQILIVVLKDPGSLIREVNSKRCKVVSFNISWSFSVFFKFISVLKDVYKFKPQIIQCWLYHSDLIGGIVGLFLKVPVIWSLRQSNIDKEHNPIITRTIIKLCAFLSYYLPAKIISNSEKAKLIHVNAGYDERKIITIPNGFDENIFFRDYEQKIKFRNELGVSDENIVIGMVGRYNSQKNYGFALKVAKRVIVDNPKIKFCFVGKDLDKSNQELLQKMEKLRLCQTQIFLLGKRQDIPTVMSGLDFLILPSLGESFPNVVGEAMLCEVPCIVSDVGDCSHIVGNSGYVIKGFDESRFASAVKAISVMSLQTRRSMGINARKRIVDNYSLSSVSRRTRQVYVKEKLEN